MNFDWQYYINIYPDLRKVGINTEEKALKHWEIYGKREGRKCFPESIVPFEDMSPMLVILIIDSDNVRGYASMRAIWKQYMNKFSPQVVSYFIRCHKTTECIDVANNTIYVKGEKGLVESFANIIHKTQYAIKKVMQMYPSIQYICRTNMSSFVHIPRLLAQLNVFPKTKLYAGVFHHNLYEKQHGVHRFVVGDNILMSRDVFSLIANTNINNIKDHFIDDVIIGHIMEINNIPILKWPRIHYDNADLTTLQQIEKSANTNPHVYQFRCKTPNRNYDAILMQKLCDIHYA
jgi:hypothetical protein